MCPERHMLLLYGINSRRRSDVQLYRPSSWSFYIYWLMNDHCWALWRWSSALEDQVVCEFSFWLYGLEPVCSPRCCSWEWVLLLGCVCPIWDSSSAAPYFFLHSHVHLCLSYIRLLSSSPLYRWIVDLMVSFIWIDGLLLFWRSCPYDFSLECRNSNTAIAALNSCFWSGCTQKSRVDFNSFSVRFGFCMYIACLFSGFLVLAP